MTMFTLRMISSRRRTLPRNLGILDLLDRRELLANLFADFDADRQQKLRLALPRLLDAAEDVLLRLRCRSPAAARRVLRAPLSSSSSRLPTPSFSCRMPIFFRPSFGTRSSSKMPGGYCARSSSRYLDSPVRDQLLDDRGGGLADAGRLDQFAAGEQLGRLGVERADAVRGALEGQRAEAVALAQLDVAGDVVERAGDVEFVHAVAIMPNMQATDRLIVAIDLSSRDEILRLADALHGAAGVFKIGLQAFVANGPSIVREVVERGEKVFLDLKIHDIPNTAKHAVAEAARSAQRWSRCTRPAARRCFAPAPSTPRSSSASRFSPVSTRPSCSASASAERRGQRGRLARLAQDSGLRGVVASPHEVAAIREACGGGIVILTPGIRPAGSDAGRSAPNDDARAAIAAGADYIVVGRPITDAPIRARRRWRSSMS